MFEARDDAGLGLIQFDLLRESHPIRVGHLDGNGPIQLLVARQENGAESAMAQHALDSVTPDSFRQRDRGGGRGRLRRNTGSHSGGSGRLRGDRLSAWFSISVPKPLQQRAELTCQLRESADVFVDRWRFAQIVTQAELGEDKVDHQLAVGKEVRLPDHERLGKNPVALLPALGLFAAQFGEWIAVRLAFIHRSDGPCRDVRVRRRVAHLDTLASPGRRLQTLPVSASP